MMYFLWDYFDLRIIKYWHMHCEVSSGYFQLQNLLMKEHITSKVVGTGSISWVSYIKHEKGDFSQKI